jgi:hypothetical protein
MEAIIPSLGIALYGTPEIIDREYLPVDLLDTKKHNPSEASAHRRMVV